MDAQQALWLSGLILQALAELEHSPGLTIEVVEDERLWTQLLPEESEEDGALAGFVINFPYRDHSGDPLQTMRDITLKPPPGTRTIAWEDDGYARIWLRPDVPLVGLAHFVGDVLERIVGVPQNAELAVRIEYGY